MHEAVLQIEKEKEERRAFIENPPIKDIYQQQERIKKLIDIVNDPGLKPSVRRKVESEIGLLEQEVQTNEVYNNQIREKSQLLEQELEGLFLESFRTLERRNQFILTHLFNNNELSGSAIDQYQNFQTRYPFAEMDSCLFATMGKPIQPFFALIVGEEESGKSILSTLLCVELLKWFKSKILFVVDHQNQRSVLEYLALKEVSNDLLSIKFADHLGDIEKALSSDNYEFLIIDSNHHYKLNESNFRKLRKMYPFLSIFLTSRYKARNIAELPSIEFKIHNNDDPDYGVIRRGWADVYTNGVLEGDYDYGIFLHNETYGFTMGF